MKHELHNDDIKNLDIDLTKRLDAFYKVIGDSTRLRILYLLRQKTLCVHEIVACLNISQSLASHQLRVLKNHKLVVSNKRKNECEYSIADDHIHMLIDIAIEHLKESE